MGGYVHVYMSFLYLVEPLVALMLINSYTASSLLLSILGPYQGLYFLSRSYQSCLLAVTCQSSYRCLGELHHCGSLSYLCSSFLYLTFTLEERPELRPLGIGIQLLLLFLHDHNILIDFRRVKVKTIQPLSTTQPSPYVGPLDNEEI